MTNNLSEEPLAVTGPAQAVSPQPYLASALSVVVGAEALPGFLEELGQHVKREVQLKESMLGPLWDEADRHENICRGEFGHRKITLDAETVVTNKPQLTIFRKSNKSLNPIRANVRYLTAKAYDEFFGTDPWSSFKPQQTVDVSTAEAVGRWGRWKIDQEGAQFEKSARQAIRSAIGNGMTVLKVQRVRQARKHAEFMQALVDIEGNPVLSPAGTPVSQDDETPVPPPVDPMTGAPLPPVGPPMVTWSSLPGGPPMLEGSATYAPHVISREVVTYDGPQMKLLFYRNFLADPKTPSIEDQPFVGDTYEIRVGELRRLYVEGLLTPEALSGSVDASTDVSENAAGKTRDGEASVREHWATLPINRFVKVAEVELDYEVPWSAPGGDGGGYTQLARLWAVVAVETGVVIWADFLGNITPEGQTHYVNVTADSDETRLFGISFPHKYEDAGDFIDATLNQVVYRNDFSANPPVVYNKGDFNETKDGKALEFKPGMSLSKTANAADRKLDELIETMKLPQMEAISQYLIDLFLKMMSTDSGVTGAAQGDVGALPQQSTATGVRSILGFGSVLHKLPIREIKSGLEKALRKFFDFALFRPAGDEFYTYFEGDLQRVEVMTAATKRKLRIDVSLSLSRFADNDRIDIQTRAVAIMKDYLSQPPPIQEATRSIYVRVLADMGLTDAEQDLPAAGLVSLALPPGEEGAEPAEGGIAPLGPVDPAESDTSVTPLGGPSMPPAA